VEYLQLLAACRGLMSRYFVHGRLSQPLDVSPVPKTFMAPKQTIMPKNSGPFPELSTAVWVTAGLSASAPPASLCVFLVTSTASAVTAHFSLRLADYGFSGDLFSVVQIRRDGSTEHVTKVSHGVVQLTRTIPGRFVDMLEVRPFSE
jgi:hypothetical protein